MKLSSFSFKSKKPLGDMFNNSEYGDWRFVNRHEATGVVIHKRYGSIVYTMKQDIDGYTYWVESEEILTMILMEIM